MSPRSVPAVSASSRWRSTRSCARSLIVGRGGAAVTASGAPASHLSGPGGRREQPFTWFIPRSQVHTPVSTFFRVNELLGPCGHAAGSVETPLTWPVSPAVSHDHVCNSAWRVPSGQLWPSCLPTVIVQRSPSSCASPLHPLELVMCATQPPEGGHADLTVQEVWAPGAPSRFNE
jgi:hypothetical protein